MTREAEMHPARRALAAALAGRDPMVLAREAGVSPRAVRDAARCRAVAVDSYLALCNALGFDARDAMPRTRGAGKAGAVAWWLVRANVTLKRAAAGQTLRVAAAAVGVSHVTLSRAEAGEALSVDSFLRIAAWLDMPPAHLTDAAPCFRIATSRRRTPARKVSRATGTVTSTDVGQAVRP